MSINYFVTTVHKFGLQLYIYIYYRWKNTNKHNWHPCTYNFIFVEFSWYYYPHSWYNIIYIYIYLLIFQTVPNTCTHIIYSKYRSIAIPVPRADTDEPWPVPKTSGPPWKFRFYSIVWIRFFKYYGRKMGGGTSKTLRN